VSDAAGELLDLLLEAGALRFGRFTLKSGAVSPFFFNLGDLSRGPHLARLGALLADGLERHFPSATLLYGPPYKGIPMVALAAAELARRGREIGTCYGRKEAKDHGEGGTLVGSPPRAGDRVVIVDDVVTDGRTKRDAAELLQVELGMSAAGVIVAVDRRPKGEGGESLAGLPLRALADVPGIARALAERGDARAEVLRRFHEGLPWD